MQGLRVEGISKRFGDVVALREVSLTLRQGEILGIIGPSGSGKTTLLRCVDLLDRIDQGRIEFGGTTSVQFTESGQLVAVDLGANQEKQLTEDVACQVRGPIGYVFQTYNLWNERTVLDNLILAPMVVRRETRPTASRRARELCVRFGIADKLNTRIWELSGGQRQRVAIIRALMMEPQIMLLDEITSALDPILTVEVMEAIKKLRDEGLMMIIVTHHLHFASSICDRIAFLSEGRILQADTPKNLEASPANGEIQEFLTILHKAS